MNKISYLMVAAAVAVTVLLPVVVEAAPYLP